MSYYVLNKSYLEALASAPTTELTTGRFYYNTATDKIMWYTSGAAWSGTMSDPMTTRGDIVYRGAAVNTRLAVGTKGFVVGTDGTDPMWVPGQTDIKAISSDNYTVLDNDGYRHIHFTTANADRTCTLGTAADNTDRIVTIKKVDSGTGHVQILGEAAGETLDGISGSTGITLHSQYSSVTLVCDGSVWHTIAIGSLIRWQKKYLTDATVSASTDPLTSMTFTLEAGKTYRITVQASITTADGGLGYIDIKDTATTIARVGSDAGTAATDDADNIISTSAIYTMTGTSLTFAFTESGNATLNGNSSNVNTWALVEELPYHLAYTAW